MATHVRDVMTSSVRTADPRQSLVEAAALMRAVDVGSVPVVDDGRLIGIVTDRDIVVPAVGAPRDLDRPTVDQVASPEPVTVAPEQELDEALELMEIHQVR